MFPNIPAYRHPEMSVRAREICRELNLPYSTGSFKDQYRTVIEHIMDYSRKLSSTADTAMVPVCSTPARHVPRQEPGQ